MAFSFDLGLAISAERYGAISAGPEQDGGKCILQLRGVRPFFSDKFDITKHPRYKYLADADKKNTFDIERYMKRRPAIVKPDEPFDLYELKATDLQPNNSTERKEM